MVTSDQLEEDDGGEDLDDLALIVRDYAHLALETPANEFRPSTGVGDLPLRAAMESPPWLGRVLRASTNPHRLEGDMHVATAEYAISGLDLVRYAFSSTLGPLEVIEGAVFVLIRLPPSAAVREHDVLNLAAPLRFGQPDSEGWQSTNSQTPLQHCSQWDQRIDAANIEGKRWLLVFKVTAGARQFSPTVRWF